jgi:integrase
MLVVPVGRLELSSVMPMFAGLLRYVVDCIQGIIQGILSMKLPKYIHLRSGTYHYQRDYPTKLRHLCQTKAFTRPLGLSANNASADQITKAALDAGEAYARHLVLITNSDPDALNATDKEKAVGDFLRKRSLSKGQYLRVAKDSAISAQEEEEQRQLQPAEYNHADWAIPEFDEVLEKQQRGMKLTLQDTIVGDAYISLINKAAAKPKTLGSLWPEYVNKRDLDVNSRKGKKAAKYWDRWIRLAGDVIIGPLTQDHIEAGLDAYVVERTGKVASASIERELNDVMSCLNGANKLYRFKWVLELPWMKKTPSKARHPLEPHQQIELFTAVLREDIKPMLGAALLLCLQGGMMTSEIGRLLPEDIALDAVLPHIKIVNRTKNDDRKRIVPIVFGLDLIKAHLAETIAWIARTTEATPSATLKKAMRRTIDAPGTSAHCLRHTLKVLGQNSGVSVLTLASIAGWADPQRKVSAHLLNYGSTGISQDAVMIKLRDDSRIMHSELIALEVKIKQQLVSNVVAFAS